MPLFKAYFDESNTHDGALVLGVAAYVFEKEACRSLDLAWKAVLDDYNLPFFHMVDCAHLAKPFDRLTRIQSIEVEKKMITLIRKHMLFGSAITVDERDYNTWAARKELGTAYSYCCWQTIANINQWMDDNGHAGQIEYFFESGHKSATETNLIMMSIGKANLYRYSSHSFVKKKCVRPVQTPDILAWLHTQHYGRILKGDKRPARADYRALVTGHAHKAFIANRETVSSELICGHPEIAGRSPSWVK